VSVGLHHVCEGEGPPLVLLAGIGMGGGAWKPVIDRLSPVREVWAVDLPGFGGSDPLPEGEPCGIDALADAAERFFAEHGLDHPHAAGNSLGGGVALELASRGSVASVTAFSPAGFASRLEQEFAGLSLRGSYAIARRIRPVAPELLSRPRLRGMLYRQMFGRPLALTPAEAFGHMEAMLEGPAFHAVLEQLRGHRFDGGMKVPATIAWGTRDGLLWPTQAVRARRELPEAKHIWLRGCGHIPMSDDPDLVTRVLLEGSAAGAPQKAVASAIG
jgi:pimeloyl-ACP methyl ester carboxylesterase